MKRLFLVAGFLGAAGADCEFDQPCADYADYMCDCHGDDPDFDCQELQDVFSDADPALQDQCAIDLAEQEEIDQANGHECPL